MIVQCPACRALVGVMAVVRVADDEPARAGAGIRCPDCSVTTFLPFVDAEVDTSATHEDPPTVAPAREEAATSGLHDTVVRALTAVQSELPSTESASEPGSLEPLVDATRRQIVEALLALGDRWEHKDAHKSVVGEAVRVDELAFLGQCYRAVVMAKPDDKGATVGRELVIAHAMATMGGTSRDSEDLLATAKRVKTAAIGFGIVLLVVALGFMLRHMGAALTEMNSEAPTANTR